VGSVGRARRFGRLCRHLPVDEGRVKFREACEYPDGSRVLAATTLEVRDGKIVRQVDVLLKDARIGLRD
jgi:hypothetical protein